MPSSSDMRPHGMSAPYKPQGTGTRAPSRRQAASSSATWLRQHRLFHALVPVHPPTHRALLSGSEQRRVLADDESTVTGGSTLSRAVPERTRHDPVGVIVLTTRTGGISVITRFMDPAERPTGA